MIRQAISCDICGADKKQTKDWLIAEERAGELRVGRWNPDARPRPATRHLCGHTCLHKLLDEFLARTYAARHSPSTTEIVEPAELRAADASLTARTAWAATGIESKARLIGPPQTPTPAVPALHVAPAVIPLQPCAVVETIRPARIDEPRNYTTRRLRAEAWQRERERELHADHDAHRRTF